MSSIHPLAPWGHRWPVALLALLGCGDSLALPTTDLPDRDASFGNGANDVDAGQTGGADGSAASDGDASGETVRLRLVHALPNVAQVVVCHDLDRSLDRPETAADEAADGPSPARPLGLWARFGEVTQYVELAPLTRGALTLHRLAPPDLDGGVGAADGGVDAGLPDPCSDETREAALPLPFDGAWLAPAASADLTTLGVAAKLDGGNAITLLASGLALSADALDRRAAAARATYLLEHPEDEDGAAQAARDARASLLAGRGALVVPALATTDEVRLAFAHLVPDLPGADDASVGALRLCLRSGGAELGQVRPQAGDAFPFRLRTATDASLEGAKDYTLRAFAAADFAREGKDCAATNLVPVAELTVPAGTLPRSATVLALGAISPDDLCAPADGAPLARPGCPSGSGDLGVRLVLTGE